MPDPKPTPRPPEDGAAPTSYAAAEAELNAILLAIESADVDVDELSANVARARALITWCRERLAAAELQVSELLADPDPV